MMATHRTFKTNERTNQPTNLQFPPSLTPNRLQNQMQRHNAIYPTNININNDTTNTNTQHEAKKRDRARELLDEYTRIKYVFECIKLVVSVFSSCCCLLKIICMMLARCFFVMFFRCFEMLECTAQNNGIERKKKLSLFFIFQIISLLVCFIACQIVTCCVCVLWCVQIFKQITCISICV